jgi:His/Glu/Gln/Arg/opine family amino acid ABC transporter permease subunit
MASIPESQNRAVFAPVINYDEPPIKPPPLLAVGPLAWMRKNLFSSVSDTLLTLVGGFIAVGVVIGFLRWAIVEANWFAITFNFRNYLLGRFEPEYEWRVLLMALFIAVVIGVCFAAWTRITRGAMIALMVFAGLLFVIPPVAAAITRQPIAYFAAGSTEIAGTGSDTVIPQAQLAFIARAGETLTIEIASQTGANDAALARMGGFTDEASNQLRVNSIARQTNAERIAEIERLLADNLVTASQRERLAAELGKLTVVDPIAETYSLNQNPVTVRILRGTDSSLIAEASMDGSAPLTVTLPEDGWYIFEKSVQGDGVGLLQVRGIYPLLERTITRSGEEAAASGGAAGSISQYARMTDVFTTEEARPKTADGKNMPMATIIANKYRGERSLNDYVNLFIGPFAGQLSTGVLALVLALLGGYGVGVLANRRLSPQDDPRRAARRMATYLLIITPLLMFVLIYGFFSVLPLTDTRRWGGLLLTIMLTFVGIVASFPLGVLLALGRRSKLPVVSGFSTLYIEFVRGVPLITVLFMAQLLVPLVNPNLAETPNVFRAMIGIVLFSAAYLAENVRGGLQAIPPGQEEAAKAVGLSGLQTTLYITLPQALRAVIPALVGQFISLFKDTSLVAIVGLLDFSGMGELVVAQTEFLGVRREVYVFLILGYFIFSYAIATVSRRIEASGSGKALARKI